MINTIYTGRVVTLNLETVALPNGLSVELEVVRHPGAAAIVPMKDEGTVVLIRQYRVAAGGYIYEIPAGKLDPGEDPTDCATRELEEEIGYRAERIEKLATFSRPLDLPMRSCISTSQTILSVAHSAWIEMRCWRLWRCL